MLNKMKTITHTRTKRGTNCYGEKYTAKYTYHDYIDDGKVICTIIEHEVYDDTVYYFEYPWSATKNQDSVYVLQKEFLTLALATEYAESYYIPMQYKYCKLFIKDA